MTPARAVEIRNVALIAHVDHGKTTLVDALLRASGAVRPNQRLADRALDSNDQERERGITILAKCASVEWRGVRINIVDTPGHADFGGEVERVLAMVDGALLLIDAAEGPMPQTRFVLAKALERGLAPVVVVNKADRRDARPEAVQEEAFDLFAALGADDAQLDFTTLFASAKEGWAAAGPGGERRSMAPLLDAVLADCPPPPPADRAAPFSMLAAMLDYDPWLGRVLTGRVVSGRAEPNMPVRVLRPGGEICGTARLTRLLGFRGLDRVPVPRAEAGDLAAVAGLEAGSVSDTIADPRVAAPLAAGAVDPPTLAMRFSVNDSPLAGREGDKLTQRLLRARLLREAEGNAAIEVRARDGADAVEVRGRGELQLGVLIETLRREGFELTVSRPAALTRTDPAGGRLEPMEEVVVDAEERHVGAVVEALGARRGEMTDMRSLAGARMRLVFTAPTRGLVGFHGVLMDRTAGGGAMSRLFRGYGPWLGPIEGRRGGALVSTEDGLAVAYALFNLEERGVLFVAPGTRVYRGMVIGEHSRAGDLEVNPLKARRLTNIRAAGKDEAVRPGPPRRLRLEEAISHIADDELVEVTPRSVRLRKALLDPHARKRARRAGGR